MSQPSFCDQSAIPITCTLSVANQTKPHDPGYYELIIVKMSVLKYLSGIPTHTPLVHRCVWFKCVGSDFNPSYITALWKEGFQK